MRVIYLDDDYKCHIVNDGTMRPYETDTFDDSCQEFIEGHRIVPAGEVWIRKDMEVFGPRGEMKSPWKDYNTLLLAQTLYENNKLKSQNVEYELALTEIEEALGVN